jgi:putative aldouronate transport system permease protein
MSVWQRIRRDRVLLLMLAPGFVFFLVFCYGALFGDIVAFEDYQPYTGFVHSVWVGIGNFAAVFHDPVFWQSVHNTIVINVVSLVLCFPAPLALALMLNSVLNGKVRKFVQSVVYLPHFIGWTIIVALFEQVLGAGGAFTHLESWLGLGSWSPMYSDGFFPFLLAFESIWKDCGWGTIIFLAALMNIEPALYEAAAIDGAGRRHRFLSVTLPSVMPVTVLLLILRLGTLLASGFQQILLQQGNVGLSASQVIDTYVYSQGVASGNWGQAGAIALVETLVGLVLILVANKVAHLLGQDGFYRRER